MHAPNRSRAVAAALSTASSLGLPADEAVVLHDSNKTTVHLLPCDTVARVAPAGQELARFELDLALRLAAAGCPVAAPDPRAEARVHEHDGHAVTLWTYHAPVPPHRLPPPDYADALHRLHAGMRGLDMRVPHFTDRVEQARRLAADRDRSPALSPADRELLAGALHDLARRVRERGAPEQLLHGEPHPGNVLTTAGGPRFTDYETCCRGPVEFDVAHAPEPVAEHYPGLDPDLLRTCRTLAQAIVTAWRWDRDDRLPDGPRLAEEGLTRLRAALAHDTPAPGPAPDRPNTCG